MSEIFSLNFTQHFKRMYFLRETIDPRGTQLRCLAGSEPRGRKLQQAPNYRVISTN